MKFVAIATCIGLSIRLPRAAADPVPIERDGNGDWTRVSGGAFPAADRPIEIRRFVQLPDLVSQGSIKPFVPQSVSFAPGDDHLYVVHLNNAQVYKISPDGSEISHFMTAAPSDFKSLVSVAFHPQFYQSGTPGHGKIYTYKNVRKPTTAGPFVYIGDSSFTFADTLVTEWNATFDSQGEATGVNPASAREVFRVAQIRGDHTAGRATFNPYSMPGDEDFGLLYVTNGENFQYSAQSQNGATALGTLMRINPLQAGANSYSIPNTNPFLSDSSILDEVYTYGHRNPHTLSFGQDSSGQDYAFIGEIGEGSAEEVNLVLPGGNYGWAEVEGTLDAAGAHDPTYVYPVAQYGHDGSGPHAVAGGYLVSNGSELDGKFIFGDFPETGDLFSFEIEDAKLAVLSGAQADIAPAAIAIHDVLFDHDDNPLTSSVPTTLRDVIRNDPDSDGSQRLDLRFGQGVRGELYITNKHNGWIYQVVNSLPPNMSGDFNSDGIADGDDLVAWVGGFGTAVDALLSQGDGNGDGAVNGKDFLIWQRAFDGRIGVATNVPEPRTLALLLLVAAHSVLLRPSGKRWLC